MTPEQVTIFRSPAQYSSVENFTEQVTKKVTSSVSSPAQYLMLKGMRNKRQVRPHSAFMGPEYSGSISLQNLPSQRSAEAGPPELVTPELVTFSVTCSVKFPIEPSQEEMSRGRGKAS